MADLPRQCRKDKRLGNEPKRCFRTLAEAEAHLNGGAGRNAYHCTHCGNYHIGHTPAAKPEPITSARQIRAALKKARRNRG